MDGPLTLKQGKALNKQDAEAIVHLKASAVIFCWLRFQ